MFVWVEDFETPCDIVEGAGFEGAGFEVTAFEAHDLAHEQVLHAPFASRGQTVGQFVVLLGNGDEGYRPAPGVPENGHVIVLE